jgi:TetR/AcrR family transcriptional regulator, transcriptional repressor for nem operon
MVGDGTVRTLCGLADLLMAALQGGLLLARTTRDVGQLVTALDMALGYVQAHAVTR